MTPLGANRSAHSVPYRRYIANGNILAKFFFVSTTTLHCTRPPGLRWRDLTLPCRPNRSRELLGGELMLLLAFKFTLFIFAQSLGLCSWFASSPSSSFSLVKPRLGTIRTEWQRNWYRESKNVRKDNLFYQCHILRTENRREGTVPISFSHPMWISH